MTVSSASANERMPDALGEIHRTVGLGVQQYRLPAAERGGAHSDVDRDVQHRQLSELHGASP